MMSFENPFKHALTQDRRLTGLWMTTGSPTVVEIAAGSGFDWLLIDMEHSANDIVDVVAQLRAAVGGTAEPVVRIPWNEPIAVKRLLDQGARSLMFPYVQSAAEAHRAVAATRYPPRGIRGFAGVSRATDYGRRRDYASRSADEICVIVQVETAEAIAVAAEIATVDGVDGVFVGPNDLAANLGHVGNVNAPPVQAAIRQALDAISGAGKAAGILNFNEAGSKAHFNDGFRFIAVSGDSFILARESERVARAFK